MAAEHRPYIKPLLLLILGTILPLAAGAALAIHGFREPQCPSYMDKMPDGSHCVIGANMSGLYIFFALPFALAGFIGGLVWMMTTWMEHRPRRK
jgi:hypothetical protein